MSYQLNKKAKSLASAARHIRLDERKSKARAREAETHLRATEGMKPETDVGKEVHAGFRAQQAERARRARAAFSDLQSYRLQIVRREARATHLARAYLRGRTYRQIEAFAYEKADAAKIHAMVQRYGVLEAGRQPVTIAEWLDEPAPARGLQIAFEDGPRKLDGEYGYVEGPAEGFVGEELQQKLSGGDDSGFVSPAAA